jgi:hypothetical protein
MASPKKTVKQQKPSPAKSPSTLKKASVTAPHPGPVKTTTKSPSNPLGPGMKTKKSGSKC